MTENMPAPGWYQDPTGLGDGRYWDGVMWTHSVSRNGVTVNVPIDESQATVPPTPGSEMVAPAPEVATPTVAVTSNRSPVGAVVGAVLAVLVVVLIVVLVSNNDSSNDDPAPATDAPAAADPPADDG